LLPIGVCLSRKCRLPHRNREQAPSHICYTAGCVDRFFISLQSVVFTALGFLVSMQNACIFQGLDPIT
jgi:hypothetical protein